MFDQTVTVHFKDNTIDSDQLQRDTRDIIDEVNQRIKSDDVEIEAKRKKVTGSEIEKCDCSIQFANIIIEYSYIALPFLLEYLVSFMIKRQDENAKLIVDNEKNKIEITSTLMIIDEERQVVLTGLSEKERTEVLKKIL
ncbi:MAG: hypothetical protein D3905_15590 [Candidatus Electrothrix sp. AS4_5]|nr:hypothetical protein [Candidatus Electrothrix gigas]